MVSHAPIPVRVLVLTDPTFSRGGYGPQGGSGEGGEGSHAAHQAGGLLKTSNGPTLNPLLFLRAYVCSDLVLVLVRNDPLFFSIARLQRSTRLSKSTGVLLSLVTTPVA